MTDTASQATTPPAEAEHRPLVPFFVLVSVSAIPFWVAAAMVDITDRTPIGLPLSALMFACPVIAAGILTYRHGGRPELVRLLKRAVDYSSERRGSYVFAMVATPTIALMSYGVAWLMGLVHFSGWPTPLAAVPVLLLAFLLAAAFEELGWTGYATDPLRRRFGALGAGLILGAFWGAWHLLPLIQAHHGPLWIVSWFVGTIALRTIVVWLYYKSGKSVLTATLMHAMANVCAAAIPDYTMTHSLLISGVLTAIVASAVTLRAQPRRRG
ncbi:hypothetical protein FHU36_003626 [Nonomuraea muscovyensis]|uniref:CAAX prenyl protease 2/Lysostaphin resistance protein A-like domain-containing protein n=1 Tax=Nonomuraea muscovyensis TaxID=1124761 RepID=A0A7X0C4S1_9ACTN|nr:CPBP family intramembrane glutamic endopeptidase [Nonomuraea muscovyensis]MBB6347081.1 hypothetical protein [Nonomuraea muscovyensis]